MRTLLVSILILTALSGRACAQDFAPDNIQAALPWNGTIQIVNTQSGARTTVPQSEDGVMAKWSSDGRYLAFVTRRGETSMRLFDTRTGVTKVLGANLTFPVAWREDSGRLAMFYVPQDAKSELIEYGVSERGINQRTDVKTLPAEASQMVWLPGTDNVAFLASDSNVYTIEEGEINKITTSSDVIGLSLADAGKSLIWARRGPNPKYILTTIYSYDLGNRSVRRTGFPSRVPEVNPDPRNAPTGISGAVFSPDGSRVILGLTFDRIVPPSKIPVRQASVYSAALDGSSARQAVTAQLGTDLVAFWSPDGRTLGVIRKLGANTQALHICGAAGEGARVVLGSLR